MHFTMADEPHQNAHMEHSSHNRVPVTLSFLHPTARSVFIAGTFNDWNAQAEPLQALGNGRWQRETNLSPGIYEYRYVVDGEWQADPSAQDTVPNPYGGVNSLLQVVSEDKTESQGHYFHDKNAARHARQAL